MSEPDRMLPRTTASSGSLPWLLCSFGSLSQKDFWDGSRPELRLGFRPLRAPIQFAGTAQRSFKSVPSSIRRVTQSKFSPSCQETLPACVLACGPMFTFRIRDDQRAMNIVRALDVALPDLPDRIVHRS